MDIRIIINPSYEWSKEAQESGISHRELEVFSLLIQGKDNKEVADILGIQYQSIKNHVCIFLKKLKAKNNQQAVALSVLHNLISIEYGVNKDINVKIDSHTMAKDMSELIEEDKTHKKRQYKHLEKDLAKHNIDLEQLKEKDTNEQ
jgi:DNA-binding CsgD family transcriptional regulator